MPIKTETPTSSPIHLNPAHPLFCTSLLVLCGVGWHALVANPNQVLLKPEVRCLEYFARQEAEMRSLSSSASCRYPRLKVFYFPTSPFALFCVVTVRSRTTISRFRRPRRPGLYQGRWQKGPKRTECRERPLPPPLFPTSLEQIWLLGHFLISGRCFAGAGALLSRNVMKTQRVSPRGPWPRSILCSGLLSAVAFITLLQSVVAFPEL